MSSKKKLKPLKPILDLTEAEWLEELRGVEYEVIHVVDVFHILEAIIGTKSEVAFDVFNAVPGFWNVVRDSLQESMFMGLGRLCDSSTDVINIRRVVNTAMLHSEFFSEQELRRRIKARNIPKEFIDELVSDVWIPKGKDDWKYLQKAINFHLTRLEDIYRPIRNSHYGHRLTDVDIKAMFAKTKRTELSDTLDALHELVSRLLSLRDNGHKPEIGVADLEHYNEQIKGYARSVIERLAGKDLFTQNDEVDHP